MKDWMGKVKPMTLKGQIALPYTWWVGYTGSQFLISLREEEKILGTRCSKCGRVYVPPRKNCGSCFNDIDEWVDVGNEGVVTAFTIVRYESKLHPVKAPFAFALVKLDGADVSLLHIITENLEALSRGSRVRARFSSKKKGHILDIESFELIK